MNATQRPLYCALLTLALGCGDDGSADGDTESTTGTSGSMADGSFPSLATALRMAARSQRSGTPVKSWSTMRATTKGISSLLLAVGCQADAPEAAATFSPNAQPEIVEAHADENVPDEKGTNVSVAAMGPLCYVTGIREYWSLGEKVADAYSAGKALKE